MPSSTEHGERSDRLNRPPMVGPNGERQFRLAKLVRPGVFRGMGESGQTTKSEILTGDRFVTASDAKLVEEAKEVGQKDEESDGLTELADTLTALIHNAALRGFSFEQVAAAEAQKTARMGGFSDGIYVHWVITQADDKWGEYYAAHPDIFEQMPFGSEP